MNMENVTFVGMVAIGVVVGGLILYYGKDLPFIDQARDGLSKGL